ncbi:vWA domain-containing protein [Loktanella sp. Alg231-35]|uniref:vWA domain-containing protein n=1 Tax=Loktanella sp. Alg231-35 TaxID=1922220 RepID=UPI000D5549EC|nr:VWA domain-containing protein [Loktanella sp. Alg231-35]
MRRGWFKRAGAVAAAVWLCNQAAVAQSMPEAADLGDPATLAPWLARSELSDWNLPDRPVNIAASFLGGTVAPATSSDKRGRSALYLNDGLGVIVDDRGFGSCLICGWLAEDSRFPQSIEVGFAGGAVAEVSAVVLDTRMPEIGPFPFFNIPTTVEILVRRDGGFETVARAEIPKDQRQNLIPLPAGTSTDRLRVVIEGTHFDSAPALAEIEVWEASDAAPSVVEDYPANLLGPGAGGRLVALSDMGRRRSFPLVLTIPEPTWWGTSRYDRSEAAEAVFAFRDFEEALVDKIVLDVLGEDPPVRVAVDVSTAGPDDWVRITEAAIDPAADRHEIAVDADARWLRLTMIAGPSGFIGMGRIQAIEGRREGYVPLFRRTMTQQAVAPVADLPPTDAAGPRDLSAGMNMQGRTVSPATADLWRPSPPPDGASAARITVTSEGVPSHRLTWGENSALPPEAIIPLSDLPDTLVVKQLAASTVVVFDVSGSMEDSADDLSNALNSFIDALPDWQEVALVRYSDTVEVLTDGFTSDPAVLRAALEGKVTPDGGTAIFDGVGVALDLLADRTGEHSIVLLGDGQDTASESSYGVYWDRISGSGVPIYSIGLGAEFETFSPTYSVTGRQFFETTAVATGGRNYYTADSAALAAFYLTVAQDLARPRGYTIRLDYEGGEGRVAVVADAETAAVLPATHVIFDLSGSMSRRLPSGQSRLDAGKEAFRALVDGLPDEAVIALTVYGSRVPESAGVDVACDDILTLRNAAPLDREELAGLVNGLMPIGGTTPITAAISQVVQGGGLPSGSKLVVITDGQEECDETPEATMRALAEAELGDLNFTLIGFDIRNPAAIERIRSLTTAGGGRYLDAADAGTAAAAFRRAVSREFTLTDDAGATFEGAVDGIGVAVSGGRYNLRVDGSEQVIDVDVLPGQLSQISLRGDSGFDIATGPDNALPDGVACNVEAANRDATQRVRRVQEKLSALGFDVGTADNAMGPTTRRGIADFVAESGLVDGADLAVLEGQIDCVIAIGAPEPG